MWCAAVHSIILIKSRTFWRPSSLRYGIPLSSFSIVSIRHVRLQNTGGFCFRRIVFRQASAGKVFQTCQLMRQVPRCVGGHSTHIRVALCARSEIYVRLHSEDFGQRVCRAHLKVVSLRSTSGIT